MWVNCFVIEGFCEETETIEVEVTKQLEFGMHTLDQIIITAHKTCKF